MEILSFLRLSLHSSGLSFTLSSNKMVARRQVSLRMVDERVDHVWQPRTTLCKMMTQTRTMSCVWESILRRVLSTRLTRYCLPSSTLSVRMCNSTSTRSAFNTSLFLSLPPYCLNQWKESWMWSMKQSEASTRSITLEKRWERICFSTVVAQLKSTSMRSSLIHCSKCTLIATRLKIIYLLNAHQKSSRWSQYRSWSTLVSTISSSSPRKAGDWAIFSAPTR